MSTIITYSAGTIVPTTIDGYQSSRPGGTIVHLVPGATDPDVTLRPAGLRTGTLRLVFSDEAESEAAEAALGTAEVFTLESTERASIPMSFVVPAGGRIERELDDRTRSVWMVSVDFQEVAP